MGRSSGRYHEGEMAAQRAAGEESAARQNGTLIGDAIVGGAMAHLRAQRMLVVASLDGRERPWASVVFGAAGFVSADQDGRLVTIDRTTVFSSDTDHLWTNLVVNAPLGLLAIDLATRRRLRINGRVESLTRERVALRVDQAYGNCPKYIQRRQLRIVTPGNTTNTTPSEGQAPNAVLLAAIRKADTAFVASGHPSRGLDASHRGGPPGFIEVLAPGLLRIPDYSGNGMFNTLGNLLVDPRCGLTILEFENARLHQMTGEAEVHIAEPTTEDDLPLAGRHWDFRIDAWRSTAIPARAEWEFIDFSPYNPP